MEWIDPKLARIFLVLSEELHFARTAERLGLRQPQVSKALHTLEAHMATPLLARTSRKVALTPAGQALCEPLRAWLAQGVDLAAVARAAARGELGRLRLGLVSPAGFGPLPQWLRAFQDAHPAVELQLREATLDVQLAALQRGELDAGLVLSPEHADAPAWALQALECEPLVLALSDAARQRLGPKPSRARLLQEPLVLFPREIAPALHDAVIDYYRAHGVSALPRQRAVQMATLIHLASADFGIAWVPASLQAVQRAGVTYCPAPADAPRCQTWLLAAEPLQPVVQAFLAARPLKG